MPCGGAHPGPGVAVLVVLVLVVAVVREALTDEEGREHREDVGLHERDEELEQEDAERHRDRPERHPLRPSAKMRPMSERMTKWPATMLAKRRTVRAKGFVNRPRISTGIMMGHSGRSASARRR